MSPHPQAPSHESASDTHHGHSHGHEAAHGSFKGYMIGFWLSVVLTAIPFWLVMGEVVDSKMLTAFLVMGLAVVQIVVHMVCFLHMNPRSEGGWTMMALIFTIVIVGIALVGSLWVMHHLNVNMMPMSPEMMKNMP
ncbi:MAG TPA: cytochrome o ubiquinol oxidase subunit IV [Pseudorhizobium sp.]|nr:cytochrome o ubiquinol oxidase subunit IV [Pseudorhizobium sp.]